MIRTMVRCTDGPCGKGAMDATDDWQERAACRGFPTALFFPAEHDDDETDGDNEIAKRICAGCPVKVECRAAQVDEPYGVRGELSAEDRGFGRRGRLGKATVTGLATAVVEVLTDNPDDEFTADDMNRRLLDLTGRAWPRNSMNAALLRTYRSGTSRRRKDAKGILHYQLNRGESA